MTGNDNTESIDLFHTAAERRQLLSSNIAHNKKEFVKSQAAAGLLSFLVEARHQLDAVENRLLAQLGKKRSSFLAFFSSPSKIAPSEAAQTIQAEFETARSLLFDINEYMLFNLDETNLADKAVRQCERFEDDLSKLRLGDRLEKHWNNINDASLFSNEMADREILGKISQKKNIHRLGRSPCRVRIIPQSLKRFFAHH